MGNNVVRAIRLKHHLTQQQLAEKLDVSRSLIDAIECGRTGVSRRTRAKLVQQFEIDDELLTFLSNYDKLNAFLREPADGE
ncbi:helix-turn-helix transcriptional regulator [Planococcus sp. FY231025]|uniref:helix-turn-helix transcriptional regulator n=1 Tax=Planococcus sp. FY231025 TaxID=3455699 RepID=UPI003F8F4DBE